MIPLIYFLIGTLYFPLLGYCSSVGVYPFLHLFYLLLSVGILLLGAVLFSCFPGHVPLPFLHLFLHSSLSRSLRMFMSLMLGFIPPLSISLCSTMSSTSPLSHSLHLNIVLGMSRTFSLQQYELLLNSFPRSFRL